MEVDIGGRGGRGGGETCVGFAANPFWSRAVGVQVWEGCKRGCSASVTVLRVMTRVTVLRVMTRVTVLRVMERASTWRERGGCEEDVGVGGEELRQNWQDCFVAGDWGGGRGEVVRVR